MFLQEEISHKHKRVLKRGTKVLPDRSNHLLCSSVLATHSGNKVHNVDSGLKHRIKQASLFDIMKNATPKALYRLVRIICW